MKTLLLSLLGCISISVYAQDITIKGYISSVSTAYVPTAIFTSSGKDYSLGNDEQSSDKMLTVLDKAGCSTGMDGNEKADCAIKVQLNQKKDTITKVLSAKKLN